MLKFGCLLVLLMVLTGCADHMSFDQAAAAKPVGFLHGFWHGWISWFAWIVSLFSSDIAIYAIYNNGGWYDFGFMLGMGGFGTTIKVMSLFKVRSRTRRRGY